MTHRTKRGLCMAMLAALMAFTAACTTPTTPDASTAPQQSTAPESKAPDAQQSTEPSGGGDSGYTSGGVPISGPGEMPIVQNPGDITLKFLVTQHPAIIDWNTNAMSKWMEEQTNIKIEYEGIPLEGRADKLNILLASNDYPDVFMGLGMSAAMINTFGVLEHKLMALDEYMGEQTPELQKIYAENPGYQDMNTFLDGKQYSMPDVNQCFHCTIDKKLWVNQTFLDALNLQVPTTIDEFYNMLVAFRDNDPNGNGKADEIPLAAAYMNGWNLQPDKILLNSYLFYNNSIAADATGVDTLGLYLDNDKVTIPYDKPEFKEGIKFMRKLYDEKLMYEGAFTANNDTLTALVENADAELVGCVTAGYGGVFSQLGGERYSHFRAVMPLKGPAGYQGTTHNPYSGLSSGSFSVSATCKYPEAVVKWADFLYTFDATTNAYYGPKDVNWRVATADEKGLDGEPALYTPLIPWQEVDPQNDHWVQQCIGFRNVAYRNGLTYDENTPLYSADGLEKVLYDASVGMLPFADDSKFYPPVKFTKEQDEALTVNKVELANIAKEYVTGFMNGTYDVDADLDTFLTKLDEAGLPAIIADYQRAYDEQFKK